MPARRRLCRYFVLVTLIGAAALAAACTKDPGVKKQQYFENGNRYFDQGKYAEAIIEYHNALQTDARFGEARMRLAQAYPRTGNGRGASQFVNFVDKSAKRLT